MRSPMQRSRKYLAEMGYFTAVTEHWNSFVKRRQDLFGFADLLAICPGQIIAVQTTSGSNAAARVRKIVDIPASLKWVQAGGRILVLSWSKRGPRGARKVWTAKERWLEISDWMEA